jgi:hypothetical protein
MADQALYEAKNQGRDRYVALDSGAARNEHTATTVLPLRQDRGDFREAAGS